MGYDIEIVRRNSDGQLDRGNSIYLGTVDGEGWEELHREVFRFTFFTDFIAQGGNRNDWDTFWDEQLKRSSDSLPLLTRLHDRYADAEIRENEVSLLNEEIERINTKLPNNAFLAQLKEAVEMAIRHDACICFIAD
jgi:hypothetical protein